MFPHISRPCYKSPFIRIPILSEKKVSHKTPVRATVKIGTRFEHDTLYYIHVYIQYIHTYIHTYMHHTICMYIQICTTDTTYIYIHIYKTSRVHTYI